MLESQVAKRIENYEPASRQQKVALFLHSAHTRGPGHHTIDGLPKAQGGEERQRGERMHMIRGS